MTIKLSTGQRYTLRYGTRKVNPLLRWWRLRELRRRFPDDRR